MVFDPISILHEISEELKEVRRPTILIKDLKILLSWYLGKEILYRLSPVMVEKLGRVVARAGLPLLKKEMRFFEEELCFILGRRVSKRELREISIRTFTNLFCQDYEIFHYKRFDKNNIKRFIRIEGLQHLEEGLKKGRGVVILISHFGSNQLIMPAIGLLGYRMNQLSSPPMEWWKRVGKERATPIYRWMSKKRWEYEQGLPVRHINIFRFLRPAYEALKNNEIVALAVDGGGGEKFVEVEFSGRRAFLSYGSFFLGAKTGSTMLPAFIVKEEGLHRLIIEPPLEVPESESIDTQVKFLAKNFMKLFETYIRRYPCHYLYFLLLRYRVRRYDKVPFIVGSRHWE